MYTSALLAALIPQSVLDCSEKLILTLLCDGGHFEAFLVAIDALKMYQVPYEMSDYTSSTKLCFATDLGTYELHNPACFALIITFPQILFQRSANSSLYRHSMLRSS